MRNSFPATLACLLCFTVLLTATPAFAQTAAFTYQGRLTEVGNPATGTYDMQFKLFDTASVGTGAQQGGTIANSAVQVASGIFTVTLDFGTSVFNGSSRFIEVGVRPGGSANPYNLLAPRQPVTPTPYAIYSLVAKTAETAATATTVASGAAVKSLNNLKDNVTLAAGANVTITPSGNTLTIASSGAGGSGLWSAAANNAYYNTGNVGIGTMAPLTPLEVNGILRSTRSNNAAQYLQLDGGDPSSIRMTAQSIVSAEKSLLIQNLSGEATPGVNNSIQFRLGTTADPSTKMTITKDGSVLVFLGGSGGAIQLGSPSAETGMTISGVNRADVRFDGSTLKLLAGAGTGIPSIANGIAITTSGNVGIGLTSPANKLSVSGNADFSGNVGMGTTTPAHRLSLIGGPLWTANSWNGALELGSGSAIGWRSNPSGKRFGIGQSTGGLYVFHTASDPGTTGSPATYDLVVTDNANVVQARDKGGLVKAMLYVNQNGTIARCYNGITDSSSGNCGFTVTRPIVGIHRTYRIDFGFRVNDRFISVTPHGSGVADVGANFYLDTAAATPNQVDVDTFLTDVTYADAQADASFMIIVY